MKRFFPALVLSASTVFACPGLAHAQATEVFPDNPPPAAADQAKDESPTLWFVELNGNPKADGGSAAAKPSPRRRK